MKPIYVLLTILLTNSSLAAQGELIKHDENAVSGFASYTNRESRHSAGFGVVYSNKGIFDFGVGIAKARGGFIVSPSVSEYPFRVRLGDRSEIILCLSQAWDIAASEGGGYNSHSIGLLAAGIAAKLPMFGSGHLIVSPAYVHAFDLSHSGSSSTKFGLAATLAFRMDSAYFSVSPSALSGRRDTAVGVTVTYTHITPRVGHHADSGAR